MSKPSSTLIILVLGLLFVGLATREGELLALGIPFVVYLVMGLFFAPGNVHLEVERSLSTDRVVQNAPVTVHLKIKNLGSSIEYLRIEDTVPAGLQFVEGTPRMITALKTGETVDFSYTLRGGRGNYRLSRLRIAASDHLGLVQKHEELTLSSRFLVVPETHQLPEVAIRPRRTRVYPGLLPARIGGPGVEFYGVRRPISSKGMRTSWNMGSGLRRSWRNLF